MLVLASANILVACSWSIALLMPTAISIAASPSHSDKPNIIYIFADQLRYESLGYAGDTKARTPHIDRLAAQSTSFRNMVSNTPVCASYRASLFTGQYSSTTGMVINELRVNPNTRCLGHVLTDAGYETGYIGKWHLWSNRAGKHSAPEASYIPPSMKRYHLGFDGYWAAFNFNHNYYHGFYYSNTPERIEVKGFEPETQTDLAIRFMEKHAQASKPFALVLSYGVPHDAWTRDNVPPRYYDMFKNVDFPLPPTWSDTPDPHMDRNTDPKQWLQDWKKNLPDYQRVYYAMIAALDDNVGRLMNALGKLGIADRTIVVFTSDHGEMFGRNARVFKLTFYDPSARVPFLIRWPKHVPAGSESDACMSTVDIMPTLLGLTNLPIPNTVDGMDLSPHALGHAGPEPDAALLQGMGHTYRWLDGFEWRAVRDKRYTYAVYRSDRSELLFDNVADPMQSRNLAKNPAHQATLMRLKDLLAKKMASIDDTFEPCTWYRDHWTQDRCILRGAKYPPPATRSVVKHPG